MRLEDKIILHSCCVPCLAGTIPILENKRNQYQAVWYNPNIFPKAEHDRRLAEFNRLCEVLGIHSSMISYDYAPEHSTWLEFIKGLENEPEKGKRCKKCFEFRLRKVSLCFPNSTISSTLTVSRHKNADDIYEAESIIGKDRFEFINFNKLGAEKYSSEICKKFNIYRQNYCGCEFSIQ